MLLFVFHLVIYVLCFVYVINVSKCYERMKNFLLCITTNCKSISKRQNSNENIIEVSYLTLTKHYYKFWKMKTTSKIISKKWSGESEKRNFLENNEKQYCQQVKEIILKTNQKYSICH